MTANRGLTQHQRIMQMLHERGQAGVLNYEFPQNFILNYKARLDELREKGYPIKTIRVKDNVWKYVLDGSVQKKDSWQAVRRQEKVKEMEMAGQERLI